MLLGQHTLSESRQLRDLPSSLELRKKIRFPVELKESNIRKDTINEKIILTEGKNSSFFLNSNHHMDLFLTLVIPHLCDTSFSLPMLKRYLLGS